MIFTTRPLLLFCAASLEEGFLWLGAASQSTLQARCSFIDRMNGNKYPGSGRGHFGLYRKTSNGAGERFRFFFAY